MPTNINFDKKLGITGGAGITLPTSSTPPTFSNTKSIALDGVDDYVDCGLGLGNSQGTITNFSVSMWIKPSVTSGNDLFFNIGSFADSFGEIAFQLLSNNLFIKIDNSAYRVWVPYTNTSAWQHLVFVYDGSNSANTKMYINGTLQSPSTGGVYPSSLNLSGLKTIIGAGYSVNYPYAGLTDEVSYFNTTLSQSDVTTIYNGGVPNNISSLSPISWWRCGDGDTAPTLTDNGSASNDGTMTNFSTFSTDVPPNSFANTQSILLDGVDDYVSVANNTTIARTQTISYSIWVNLVDGSARQYIIGNQTSSNGGTGLSIESGGFLLFQVADGTNDSYFNSKVTNFTTYAPNNTWNHILATFDGANAKIFINGILRNNWSVTTPYTISNYSNFWIGRRNANTSQLTNGKLDEIALFNTDQSANASTIYNGGVPNDISSLSPVSWWRFEGSGTTATDSGSGGNNGTLTNGVVRSTDVPT